MTLTNKSVEKKIDMPHAVGESRVGTGLAGYSREPISVRNTVEYKSVERALEQFDEMEQECEGAYGTGKLPPEVKKLFLTELTLAYEAGMKDTEERVRKWANRHKGIADFNIDKLVNGVILDDLLSQLKQHEE